MRCPVCHNFENRVLESRAADAGQSVRRRRECLKCGHRFTTYERIEFFPIMVVKRTGQREVFNREKLTQGVLRACEKTSVTEDQIQELVNQLESELQCQTVREVSSAEIGEMVLEQLRSLNQVAYIRFASVYSQFQNVQDFVAILDKMQASPPGQLATISTEI